MIAATVMHPTLEPQQAIVSPYAVDGSSIVQLVCDNGNYTGTAFYLGDGLYMTAGHMASSKGCRVGGQVVTFLEKGEMDWATFSAKYYPPFRVTYSCNRPTPGQPYLATGYALGYAWQVTETLRASNVVDPDDGSREFKGAIIPGQSGGPVADLSGVVYGIVAWRRTLDGVPVNGAGAVDMADTSVCRKNAR